VLRYPTRVFQPDTIVVSYDRQHRQPGSQPKAAPATVVGAAFTYPLDRFAPISGSRSAWRMAMPLSAYSWSSQRNGGRGFLIFVADPITMQLLRSAAFRRRLGPRTQLAPPGYLFTRARAR